jgi:hypothetical protein
MQCGEYVIHASPMLSVATCSREYLFMFKYLNALYANKFGGQWLNDFLASFLFLLGQKMKILYFIHSCPIAKSITSQLSPIINHPPYFFYAKVFHHE